MNKDMKVALIGIGAMGKLIAEVLVDRNIRIVGAFDKDKNLVGKDLGKIIGLKRSLGVTIDGNLDNLRKTDADVAIYATVATLKELLPQILPAIKGRIKKIISTNEELCYPWYLAEAEEIDKLAKRYGVTVFGTGVNPGFTADVLPVALTSLCHEVTNVEIKRVVDLSPYSIQDMRMWGIGLSIEEWRKLAQEKKIGQIGMKGSVYYVADSVGVKLDEVTEELEPITAKVRRKGHYVIVEPGRVACFKQKITALAKGKEFISYTMIGDLDPRAEKINAPGVTISIIGKPNINVELKGTSFGSEGAIATTARIVNMLPVIMEAPAGLITQNRIAIGPCCKYPSLIKA
ncbi:MAG: hypothetical protein ACPL3B_07030 [Fervidobacterium sp.]